MPEDEGNAVLTKDIDYAKAAVDKSVNAPKYVRKQCRCYLKIVSGRDKKYCIDKRKREQIISLTRLLVVALINAVYLLQTFELQNEGAADWAVMV